MKKDDEKRRSRPIVQRVNIEQWEGAHSRASSEAQAPRIPIRHFDGVIEKKPEPELDILGEQQPVWPIRERKPASARQIEDAGEQSGGMRIEPQPIRERRPAPRKTQAYAAPGRRAVGQREEAPHAGRPEAEPMPIRERQRPAKAGGSPAHRPPRQEVRPMKQREPAPEPEAQRPGFAARDAQEHRPARPRQAGPVVQKARVRPAKQERQNLSRNNISIMEREAQNTEQKWAAAPMRRPVPRPAARPGSGPKEDKASFAHDKELKFRHELKFYINYRDYVVLRQSIKALLAPDENGDETGSYLIRSMYFDDRDDTALAEKLMGIQSRAKYRVRIYNYSDGIIRFEKKIKAGQYIAKKSMQLSRREYDAILAGQCDFLLSRREALAKELYLQLRQQGLRPRVIVDYEREAYVMPYENVRITFDKNLRSGPATGDIFSKEAPTIPIAEKGIVVLEVKFNKYLPDYIRGILDGMDAPQRSAISKYVLCRKYE